MKQRKITVQEEARKKEKNRQKYIQIKGKNNSKSNKQKKRKHHWINLNYNTFLLKHTFDLSCMRMATILDK
jgi:hypothetical protein